MADEEDEQGEMFPDLDPKNENDKRLITAAKKWIKIVDERQEVLNESKQRHDEAHDKMVEIAMDLKIEKFAIAGRTIEISTKRKAKCKTKKLDGEDEDDSAGE